MKNKPKILIIGTTEETGGAAGVGWNIGEELRRRGYWVRYIVGYKKSNDKKVYQLKQPKLLEYLEEKTKLSIPALVRHFRSFLTADDMSFGASKEIFNHPWYKKADIVHLHNKHGNYIKFDSLVRMDKEKKLIWTLHDMWAITGHCAYTTNSHLTNHDPLDCETISYPPTLWNNDINNWQKKKSIYKQLKNITYIIPSKWLYNKVMQTPLKNHRVTIINNGINTKLFKAKSKKLLKKQLGLDNKKFALFVAQGGKSNPRKNYVLFEKIAQKFTNKSFEFISIGGVKTKIVENNITHIPFISDKNDLVKYFQAADVVISPSKAEICALTLLESLLVHTPVISFNTGIASEVIINKKNGYVMNSFNLDKWVRATKEVLNNSHNYEKFIKDIRPDLVKKYSVEAMVDQYINIYTK